MSGSASGGIGFATYQVAGGSMAPTLFDGDVVIVRKTKRVKPGDIVVARHPHRANFTIVKRVVRAESGGWWIEGDNAAATDDSRSYGAVDRSLIIGKVIWTRKVSPARPQIS